jgi:hypothetical protein
MTELEIKLQKELDELKLKYDKVIVAFRHNMVRHWIDYTHQKFDELIAKL